MAVFILWTATLLRLRASCSPLNVAADQLTAFPEESLGFEKLGAISPEALNTFNIFEQYAAASYCQYNDEHSAGGHPLNCQEQKGDPRSNARGIFDDVDVCPWIENQPERVTTYEFLNEGVFASSGFIAVDNILDIIVLSYRGTKDFKNLIVDYRPEWWWKKDWCWLCFVELGFYAVYEGNIARVKEHLWKAVAENPGKRVVIVGHSLGGAMASYAAIDFRKSGLELDLYTFGQPRIGNSRTSGLITGSNPALGQNFRFSMKNDPIPGLPPWELGFWHWGPQYYIDAPPRTNVTADQVTQYGAEIVEENNPEVEIPHPEPPGGPPEPGSNGARNPAPLGFDTKSTDANGWPTLEAHWWYFRWTVFCDWDIWMINVGQSLTSRFSTDQQPDYQTFSAE